MALCIQLLLLDSSNHSMGSLLNQDNQSQDCFRSYFCTDEHISNCTKKPQVTNIFIEKRFSSYLIIIVKKSLLCPRQTCQMFPRYNCLIYHPISFSRKTSCMFYYSYYPCYSFKVIYRFNTSPLTYQIACKNIDLDPQRFNSTQHVYRLKYSFLVRNKNQTFSKKIL